MQVQVEELAPCKVALHIEVDADRVREIQDKAFKEVAPFVNVPGFRRGKAPKPMIQRYMNEEILRQQTLRLLIPSAVDDAIKESGLEAYDEPELTEEPEYTPGEPLKFTATFTTPPKVELGQYTGLRIEYPSLEVADEDVERSIDQLRQQRAALQAVERPAETGDFVSIDYVAHVEGEEDQSGPMLRVAGNTEDPLDQAILGHSAGETVTVEAPLHTDETKNAAYDVTIKEVRNWVVPEINDEFAQSIGYDHVDGLRQTVKERIQQQAASMVKEDIENRLLETIRENSTLTYPSILVDRMAVGRMESLMEELDERDIDLESYLEHEKMNLNQLEQEIDAQSHGIIEAQLLLREIGRAQNFQVTEAQLAEALGEERDPEMSIEDAAQQAANQIMYQQIMAFLRENNELVPTGGGSVGDADSDAGTVASEETDTPAKEGGIMSRLFRRRSGEPAAAEEASGSETEPVVDTAATWEAAEETDADSEASAEAAETETSEERNEG